MSLEKQSTAPLKSLLLRAWRERWSDTKWSVYVKKSLTQPRGSVEESQLADLLLQQALVGSSPNTLVLSYLRHAVSTQMISYTTTIKSIIKYRDIGKLFCTRGLMELVGEMASRISWQGMLEDSLALCKASVSLILWLLESLHLCLQKITSNKMTSDYSTLTESICDCIELLTKDRAASLLLYIGMLEETDVAKQVEELTRTVQAALPQCVHAAVDLRKKMDCTLRHLHKVQSLPSFGEPIVEGHCHSLNITINGLLNVEVILNPTSDIQPFVEQLLIIEKLQGLTKAELYCEVMRSCFMGLIDAAGSPNEFKWVAFTFLKLPQALSKMIKLGTESEASQQLEESIKALLEFTPLLDLADAKIHCDCLQFFFQELKKLSLISDLQYKKFLSKRQLEGQRKPPEVPGQQPSVSLILRAVPTVTSILKTLDADYSKNQDGLLGVLSHMMSGKSFELILAAAAAMGQLQSFASKLIKFNEFAKQSSGEAGKAAQTRALLFDISFLMLCHITQLYGSEIILPKSEVNTSFFAQWAMKCLPEDGKYKSPGLMAPRDPKKVEVLLTQFNPGGELKTNLTRWNEVCHNAPYAIQEVLYAWEHRAISQEDVKVIMDNVKSLMCCLPVIVSSWLCSYINLVDHDIRKKPRLMLQQLCTACHTPDPDQFYNERSNLMQVILTKMIQDVLPPGSQRRNTPYVLPPTASAKAVLLETFTGMFKKGCADILSIYKMDHLLAVGGPRWFCENLVREVLNHDRPEDLSRGIGLLYTLFHMDLENLVLLLFHHTLPTILQADDTRLSVLTDPRGRYLAKLCIMCLVAVHKLKQSERVEASPCRRGRKRTRADIELEEEEDLIEEEARPSKIQKLPGSEGLSPAPAEGAHLGEILSSMEDEFMPSCNLKEPLNKALANLFRLFSAILNHSQASQRTGFLMSFIDETIKSGNLTARYCLQFMPPSMVSQLIKMFPKQFSPKVVLAMCDITTVTGRRVASKVISQQAKSYRAASCVKTWP